MPEEIISLIQEGINVLRKQEEIATIINVASVARAVERAAKDITDEASPYLEGVNGKNHAEIMFNLQKQRDSYNEQIKRADADSRATQQHIDFLQLEEKRLEVAKMDAMRVSKDVTPAYNTLGLYANIARIQWDFDAPCVKGVIIKADENDVVPFEFKPHASQFDITNKLWDLM